MFPLAVMPKQDPTLMTAFTQLAPELVKHESLGAKLINCPCCGYRAALEEPGFVPLFFYRCLLCNARARYVRMTCECECSSVCDRQTHDACSACAKPFSYSDVVQQNQPSVCCTKPSCRQAGNSGTNQATALAKCHVCEKRVDSVYHFDEQWLCLNCLTEHRAPGTCEDCQTVQTGDLEDSFTEGCMECGGRVSWD